MAYLNHIYIIYVEICSLCYMWERVWAAFLQSLQKAMPCHTTLLQGVACGRGGFGAPVVCTNCSEVEVLPKGPTRTQITKEGKTTCNIYMYSTSVQNIIATCIICNNMFILLTFEFKHLL